MADNKKFSRRAITVDDYDFIWNKLEKKYYNLWRSNFKCTNINYRQQKFIFDKLWYEGKIGVFKIKHTEDLGYASWAMSTKDMYGQPETITFQNEFGSPLVPVGPQRVDDQCVIGWIQSNRWSVLSQVSWYLDRIAQVILVEEVNLHLQKMSYLIPVEDDQEAAKLQDITQRILNNELVIFVNGVDPNIFASINTKTEYLLDKLINYRKALEADLKTYLGINCSGAANKAEQNQLSEVNSNNEEINLSDTDFENNLQEFCERVKETLGVSIDISVVGPDAEECGEEHQLEEKTGPKGTGEEE